MPKMKLYGSWLKSVHELDATYPKKVSILVDKFNYDIPADDEVRIVVIWEPDGRIISPVMDRPECYDYVFTYHQYVLDNNPKAHLFLGVTMFVDPNIEHEKRFGVSTVVGHKRKDTFPGYNMRHQLWFRQEEITIPREFFISGGHHFVGNEIPTAYGNINVSGQRRLRGTKDEVFDTMFHIAIENVHTENFFTEKICDCFATRTIPVYIGASNIGEFFDGRGIISVKNIDEAIAVCNTLTEDDYHSRTEAMEINYAKAIEYMDYNQMLTKKILEVLP